MSDLKIKQAAGKVPLNLIPLSALKGAARVFQHGAFKYEAGNFLLATDDDVGNRYVGGFLRHVSDAQRPDGLFDLATLAALDVESGLPEIDHAICGLIMLRAILAKRGALPADPGLSKLLRTEPVDVHAPSVFPEGDPGAIRPFTVAPPPTHIDIPASAEPIYGPNGWITGYRGADVNQLGTEPADVHAPSIFPEGNPGAIRPPRPTGPGDTGRPMTMAEHERAADGPPTPQPGPRFIVVPKAEAGDRPAEFSDERWCREYAAEYNSGSVCFQPEIYGCDAYRDDPERTHAIVDTRPEEG